MIKPKFKAFNINTLDYAEDVEIIFSKDGYTVVNNFNETIPAFLLQSTHLKDKEDNELYDGDIVMMRWTVYDEEKPFMIWQSRTGEWRVDNRISGRPLAFCIEDVRKIGHVLTCNEDMRGLANEWEFRQKQRKEWLH